MVPCKSTAEEVSFQWLHHRFLLTESKVKTSVNVSTIASGSEIAKEAVSSLVVLHKTVASKDYSSYVFRLFCISSLGFL